MGDVKLMPGYEAMDVIFNDIRQDVESAEKGNKAAGVRVRKAMQELKKKAGEMRVLVLKCKPI